MSARQEKVREVLGSWGVNDGTKIAAALAEVEEWEDIRDGLERLLQRRMDEMQRIEHRAEAAEKRADWLYKDAEAKHGEILALQAEADRLKAALEEIANGPGWHTTRVADSLPQGSHLDVVPSFVPSEIARAALAPADRNTA